MLRTLFKEHGFYLKVSKDFDVRCNVTDLNFREAVLAALQKMNQKGLRTQSSKEQVRVYCKSWGEKWWSGMELEQWVLWGEEGVGFERLLEVECPDFRTWWPLGLKEERERMESNFCISSFGDYLIISRLGWWYKQSWWETQQEQWTKETM